MPAQASRMSVLLPVSLLLLASLAAGSSTGETSDRGSAHEALRRAIESLGGDEAVSAGGTIAFTQRGRAFTAEQARNPADSSVESVRRNRYVIDQHRSRFRLESSTVFPGEIDLSTLLVLDGDAGFTIDPGGWRAGSDITRIPAELAAANFAAGTRVLPHLLVMQALSYAATLTDEGTRAMTVAGGSEGKGESYRVIGYRDVSGAAIGVYLDPDSFLVRGYEVRRGQAHSRVLFGDFRDVSGLQVPHSTRTFLNDVKQEVLSITQVTIAPGIADSAFVVPAGYSDPPAPGEPRTVRLADGTFLLEDMPNDYRSMFVDMGDHVVVLEAPVSRAYGETALRLIGETLPGKPVRYVLVTHHHGDHTGGLAPYIEQGATIVTGTGAEVAIRRQFAGMTERLRIETVTAPRSFTGAGRRVVVHRVDNAHADASLVFHLPAPGILFQGDLLYVPRRGPVPAAFAAAEPLAELIRAKNLRVQAIVGVHGRTADVADLQQAITLRRRAAPVRSAESAARARALRVLGG